MIAVATFQLNANAAAAEMNFGVIDPNKIAESSDAYKKAMEIMGQKEEEFAKEAGNIRETLVSKDRELEKQKNVLSPTEYAKRRDTLDIEIQNQENIFYKKRVSIDNAGKQIGEMFADKASDTVKDIAKDKNLKIVFSKDSRDIMSYYDPSLEITKDVISSLNKSLKSIPVEISDPKMISKKQSLQK